MTRFLQPVSACAAALALAAPGAVQAQTGGDWTGQVTLYGWGAGIGGDLRPLPGAPTVAIDKSLSEVLEDLDFAFFVTGLALRDRLVLFGDLSYSSSSRDGLIPPGLPAQGEFVQRSITLAAGQRVLDDGTSTIDLLGGFRAWQIDVSAQVPLAGLSAAPEKSFVDPIIALRGNTRIAPRWSLLGYLDVGGFGVGSDLTYQIAVTANYQVTDNLYLSAGYRHLYLDYNDGGTSFDGGMSGPLVGVTWRF